MTVKGWSGSLCSICTMVYIKCLLTCLSTDLCRGTDKSRLYQVVRRGEVCVDGNSGNADASRPAHLEKKIETSALTFQISHSRSTAAVGVSCDL